MMRWSNSIYSDGSKYYVSNPYPKLGESIQVLVRVQENNDIKAMLIRQMRNGEEHVINMKKCPDRKSLFVAIPDDSFLLNDYFIGEMIINEPLVQYHFIVATEKGIFFYNQLEITDFPPVDFYDFKIKADYEPSEWVHRSVFYQIFPDRFYNGDASNDVETDQYGFDGHKTVKMHWDEPPKEYRDVHCLDFYGGDLQGIQKKIGYLKTMNVNAIYVNPIFYAATSHKYDCLDYFKVDPAFGGDEALINLTDEMHKNDMRLMVDVSINHTGTAHKWFNKEGTFYDKSVGAYYNPNSAERQYYFFSEGDDYHAWMGVDTLPTLNYSSSALRDIIYAGNDSLVKHWLKKPFDIDSWRFDVANTMARLDDFQMSDEVFEEIRKSIKEVKKDAYIIGEMWTDATAHLQGDQWDSAMNYFGFTRPVRQFVGDEELYYARHKDLAGIMPFMDAKQLSKRVRQQLASIPHQLQLIQFNLLNSHDVYRLHNNPEIDFEDNKAAVTMMFTFPGTPNVYYGDEIGIDGRIDTVEGCRYPMVWDEKKQDKGYMKLYQELGQLKQHYEPLADGGFKILYAEGKVLVYSRFTHQEALIVGISQEEESKVIQVPTNGLINEEVVELAFNGRETVMKQYNLANMRD